MAEERCEQIKEFGIYGGNAPYQVLTIIGQIEGHTILNNQSKTTKYEHMIPLLTDAELSDSIKGILVLLNTMGGDVEAGLAIAELIRGCRKPSVSLVLGGGHSIGVPLAVSTDYSFIVPTASMTVHPIRTSGLFIATWQSFAYVQKMQERVETFIAENSKIQKEKLEEMMNNQNQLADDTGTVLIGRQAVEAGLIDQVGGLSDALAKLEELTQK